MHSCELEASSESTDRDPPSVECQIENAHEQAGSHQKGCRDVGINKLVQVMKEKAALIRLDAGLTFEPVLKNGQRTGPRKQFGKNSPNQGCDVQPAKYRARTRQKSTEDYPQNEQRMQ